MVVELDLADGFAYRDADIEGDGDEGGQGDGGAVQWRGDTDAGGGAEGAAIGHIRREFLYSDAGGGA